MNERINRDGQKFGMLTVLRDGNGLYEGKKKKRSVICRCDCGNERELLLRQIQKGKQKSCGCLGMPKTEVNPGDKFNLWTVIDEAESRITPKGDKSRHILVECVCGVRKSVNLQTLKKGQSKSCSCRGIIREEKIVKEKIIPIDTEEEQWKEIKDFEGYYISTLGRLFNYNIQYMFPKKKNYEITLKNKDYQINAVKYMYKTFIEDYDEKEYLLISDKTFDLNLMYLRNRVVNRKLSAVYGGIRSRINNKNNPDYIRYGGRGVIIEESFDTYEKFYKWSINNGFEMNKGLQIDRIDNDGNYSSENCRWISQAENKRNTSRNVLTWELVEKIRSEEWGHLTASEISNKLKIKSETIRSVRNYATWVK